MYNELARGHSAGQQRRADGSEAVTAGRERIGFTAELVAAGLCSGRGRPDGFARAFGLAEIPPTGAVFRWPTRNPSRCGQRLVSSAAPWAASAPSYGS